MSAVAMCPRRSMDAHAAHAARPAPAAVRGAEAQPILEHSPLRLAPLAPHSASVRQFEPAGELFVSSDAEEAAEIGPQGPCPDSKGRPNMDGGRACSADAGRAHCLRVAVEATGDRCAGVRVIAIPRVMVSHMFSRLEAVVEMEEARRRPGPDEDRTTVMLQRIAYDLDEDAVRHVLSRLGFEEEADAVYVPRSTKKNVNLGYAFVNFTRPEDAAACIRECSGRTFGNSGPARTCSAAYSRAQGLGYVAKRVAATIQEKRRRARRAAALQ
mmetsp:Transcript_110693/g.309347  ORF Transcript_110693/g.309347 Transcript_110693/m.309347 type:complete len:270 (-) Transcript_110693:33-842(-)